jgi:pimeloyl-ACP methyl ester carboxylesterase
MRVALVHSPLVGPATWRGVAGQLSSLRHDVDVPDLRGAAQTGDPAKFIDAAQSALAPDTQIVAGHSGGGFFLPSIAAALHASVRLVFVDAGIPPCAGTAAPSSDFLDQLRSLAVDGILPRWSTWWGDGAMERLVPDERLRDEVEAELGEVPLRFYETPIELPDEWCSTTGAFVLLSEGYRDDAVTAASMEWPVVELLGMHLDLVNNPGAVARAIASVASAPEA